MLLPSDVGFLNFIALLEIMKCFFNTGFEVIELFRNQTEEQDIIGDLIQQLVSNLPSYSLIDKIEIEADFEQGSLEEMLRKDNPLLANLWEHESFVNNNILPWDAVQKYYEELEKKKGIIYYYVEPKPAQKRVDYYIFNQDWVTILRVSQAELGPRVLGIAYIGKGLIKILDILYGDDFVEVKKHELLHIQYPQKSEAEIRQMTKQAMGYQTRYQ